MEYSAKITSLRKENKILSDQQNKKGNNSISEELDRVRKQLIIKSTENGKNKEIIKSINKKTKEELGECNKINITQKSVIENIRKDFNSLKIKLVEKQAIIRNYETNASIEDHQQILKVKKNSAIVEYELKSKIKNMNNEKEFLLSKLEQEKEMTTLYKTTIESSLQQEKQLRLNVEKQMIKQKEEYEYIINKIKEPT